MNHEHETDPTQFENHAVRCCHSYVSMVRVINLMIGLGNETLDIDMGNFIISCYLPVR